MQINSAIANEQETQQLLSRSTASSQATLGQLIELHRAAVERGADIKPDEQAAFAESEALFLKNQRQYQEANDEIARLTARRQGLEKESADVARQIDKASAPARRVYEQQWLRHHYRQAAYKLGFLLPVLLVTALLVMRMGASVYRPIVFPLLPAALLLTGMVMHEHFPSRLFKYVAIVAGIAVVIILLYRLIRLAVAPRGDWLVSRYREAYQRGQCPVCALPMADVARRGGITVGADGSLRLTPSDAGPAEPYSCAACGTRLFEICPQCQHVRHALLPYCTACGARAEVVTPDSIK
jgi:hypothetical protein